MVGRRGTVTSIHHVGEGFPAVGSWLCAQCTIEIKYTQYSPQELQIQPGTGEDRSAKGRHGVKGQSGSH